MGSNAAHEGDQDGVPTSTGGCGHLETEPMDGIFILFFQIDENRYFRDKYNWEEHIKMFFLLIFVTLGEKCTQETQGMFAWLCFT